MSNNPSIKFDSMVIPFIKDYVSKISLDNQSALFMERALTKVIKEANVLHTMNSAQLYVPIAKLSDPGQKTTEVICYEALGEAACINPCADDVPMIQLIAKSKPMKVKFIAVGYDYCRDDLKKAAAAGMNLDTRLRDEALEAINRKYDQLMQFGEGSMTGLFNDANVTLTTLPHPGAWEGLTNVQVMENVLSILSQVKVISKKRFAVNTAIFALTLRCNLETRYNEQTGRSLYDELSAILALRGVPMGAIFGEEDLETAGVGGTRRVMFYQRDPRVLQANVPQGPTTIPAQVDNFKIKFLIEAYYGGLNFYYPIAAIYADVPA